MELKFNLGKQRHTINIDINWKLLAILLILGIVVFLILKK